MIVLDTNIVSALMRPVVDAPVQTWMVRRMGVALATTVVSVMEIRYGIERTPAGKRRADMEEQFEKLISPSSGFDVLPVDDRAASAAGAFLARRDVIAMPATEPDMMIAGIVASVGGTLVTRNVRDFVGLAIPIDNPYQDG